jgi:hypothetical protein
MPFHGRRGPLRAFRLLSGIVVLLALGASSSHSHEGHLSSSHQCAVCQVASLHLDVAGDLPALPPPVIQPEEEALGFPESYSPRRALNPTLPRAPPFVA